MAEMKFGPVSDGSHHNSGRSRASGASKEQTRGGPAGLTHRLKERVKERIPAALLGAPSIFITEAFALRPQLEGNASVFPGAGAGGALGTVALYNLARTFQNFHAGNPFRAGLNSAYGLFSGLEIFDAVSGAPTVAQYAQDGCTNALLAAGIACGSWGAVGAARLMKSRK